MELSNNNVTENEMVEMYPEKVSDWDTNCYLYARALWSLNVRNVNNIDVKGFRGEVVDHVGLHGIYKINEILDEYFDIWEAQIEGYGEY